MNCQWTVIVSVTQGEPRGGKSGNNLNTCNHLIGKRYLHDNPVMLIHDLSPTYNYQPYMNFTKLLHNEKRYHGERAKALNHNIFLKYEKDSSISFQLQFAISQSQIVIIQLLCQFEVEKVIRLFISIQTCFHLSKVLVSYLTFKSQILHVQYIKSCEKIFKSPNHLHYFESTKKYFPCFEI